MTTLIGAGGMGEVYRARDTKLDRDVALKVLPDSFTGDADRLARFEREAKTLAALNHPHIAHVYGLEDANTGGPGHRRALVMELVEGEDLAERIRRGPIPIAEVIQIAGQVAGAVASAHDRGIVHRDLKPANIKVTPDRTVKVLDFGLAKALDPEAAVAGTTPTITEAGTAHGVILGTAAYMSPEQARGQAVDARTDIWAFGCLLFEMLAGRLAFPGATTSEKIAKILEREPAWDALPSSTPASLRRLLTRCLEKDQKHRLHAIADAQFELEEALAESRSPARTAVAQPASRLGRWPLVGGAVAGVVALLVAFMVWWIASRRTADLSPMRVLSLTSYPGVESSPAFSPDGKQVAFSWEGENGDNEDIYVLIVGDDSPLHVTKDPARDVSPAWKPDGSQIAFARLAAGRAAIYVASPHGGSEQKLAEFTAIPSSAGERGTTEESDPRLSWSPDGRWLMVSRVTQAGTPGMFLVAAANGTVHRLLTSTNVTDDYRMAVFSPKGNAVAFINGGALINGGFIEMVRVAATNPPTANEAPKRLTSYLGTVGGLAWSADGSELLFGRAPYPSPSPPYLWRVPSSGDRAPERIDLAGIGSYPAVSQSGARLAYVRRGLQTDLFRLQEGAPPEPLLASTFNEFDASFSPDGTKVAFATDRGGEGNEIWVAHTSDASTRRSLTRGTYKPEGSPRWSPNGDRLAFDGVGEDGARHVYLVDEAGGRIQEISHKSGFYDQVPSWSRDGRWIYFASYRSGRSEVWRAPASGGAPQQVSTTGGSVPFESWDGTTLYYLRENGPIRSLFSMPVGGGPERSLGITTAYWNYLPVERGIYYVAPKQGQKMPFTFEVRLLDFATGANRAVYSVRLADISPGLSVAPDGKTVLIAGVAEITQDLMRIENFR